MSSQQPSALEASFSRRTLSITAVAWAVSACGGGTDSSGTTTVPRITSQPADISGSVGGSATFGVIVESSEPVTYQWLRDGVAIAGARSAQYTLPSVSEADSGSSFAVLVGNSAGQVESRKARLSVLPNVDTGNIALATGLLAALGPDQWFVASSKSGDVFVWERDSSRLVRYDGAGNKIPFAGSLQSFAHERRDVWQPSIGVLEHSDGNLYVSFAYLKRESPVSFNLRGDGGHVYRITADGTVSVVYSSDFASTKISPYKLIEGPGSQLYTVHVNTVALYKLTTAGTLTKVQDLAVKPIVEQPVSELRYAPYISLVVTQDLTVYVSFNDGIGNFDLRLDAGGSATTISYGPKAAKRLAAVGNTVYAYTDNAAGIPIVVRRTADGKTDVITGGSLPPRPGQAQFDIHVSLGPLPRWIPPFTQTFSAAPGGRILMGGNHEVSNGYRVPYYLLTPPPVV